MYDVIFAFKLNVWLFIRLCVCFLTNSYTAF